MESREPRSTALELIHLPPARADEAVDVLTDAFRRYPVMLRVLGPGEAGEGEPRGAAPPSEERLRRLVRFFVLARALSGDPILALQAGDEILGVATLSVPGRSRSVPELDEVRVETWAALGPDAEARYRTLCAVWETFSWPERHHHLNMIGVRRGVAGRGLGRRLLDAVHHIASRDGDSAGVSLTTETASNVDLYRHVGYEVVAEGRLTAVPSLGLPEIRSWGLFRATER